MPQPLDTTHTHWDVDEYNLELASKCPLMDSEYIGSPRYRTACQTLIWALTAARDGGYPTLKGIREKFTENWKATYYQEFTGKTVPPDHPTYWQGPRVSRTVAKRIVDLLNKFNPVNVNYIYSVMVDDDKHVGVVKGLVTTLSRKSQPTTQFKWTVLILHESVPRHHLHPDVTSMARWLWLRKTSSPTSEVNLYHLPLLHGKPWTTSSFIETEVVRALACIMNVSKQWPSPGSHCQQCVSKRCTKFYA
jgi:hypothetical protein